MILVNRKERDVIKLVSLLKETNYTFNELERYLSIRDYKLKRLIGNIYGITKDNKPCFVYIIRKRNNHFNFEFAYMKLKIRKGNRKIII